MLTRDEFEKRLAKHLDKSQRHADRQLKQGDALGAVMTLASGMLFAGFVAAAYQKMEQAEPDSVVPNDGLPSFGD